MAETTLSSHRVVVRVVPRFGVAVVPDRGSCMADTTAYLGVTGSAFYRQLRGRVKVAPERHLDGSSGVERRLWAGTEAVGAVL